MQNSVKHVFNLLKLNIGKYNPNAVIFMIFNKIYTLNAYIDKILCLRYFDIFMWIYKENL